MMKLKRLGRISRMYGSNDGHAAGSRLSGKAAAVPKKAQMRCLINF